VTETNPQGEDIERDIPFMTPYTVFNVEQVDGLPSHYYARPENPLPVSERIEAADAFMKATGATVQHGGNSAFYSPALDIVKMPPFEAFRDKESYYATALHELTHWTKHESRLHQQLQCFRTSTTGC
jgi:antirestriction protein ArdC